MKNFNNSFNYIDFICNNSEEKLRDFLKNQNLSSRFIRKVTLGQCVYVNGVPSTTNNTLVYGDNIRVYFPEEENHITPEEGNLDILFEDGDLLIVNKPSNMPVHTAKGYPFHTLSNRVSSYFKRKEIHRKIRPVNRLDKDTTGIVIFAKNSPAQEGLIQQLKVGSFERKYVCLCEGSFETSEGLIELPIDRSSQGIKRIVSDSGKVAKTEYKVLKVFSGHSLVECKLHTGRTHQIRVHMKAIGHPILGDNLYGTENVLHSLALHSRTVAFKHPRSQEMLKIQCSLTPDMVEFSGKIID